MNGTKYELDLTDQTGEQIADLIVEWREDEGTVFSEAFDLLNSIEPWLRANHIPDVGKVISIENLTDKARSFCLRRENDFSNDPVIHRLMANFAAEVSK